MSEGKALFQMTSDEDGEMQPSGDHKNAFLQMFVDQQHMKDQLQNILRRMDDHDKQRAADKFGFKDVVTFTIAGIASVSVLMAGLFFLIGTQVSPVVTRMDTFEKTIGERMNGIGETLRGIRKDTFDMNTQIGDMRVLNAQMKATIQDQSEARHR